MSEVQAAIATWEQHKTDLAQAEAEVQSLRERLGQQKEEAGLADQRIQTAKRGVSSALTKADLEQARAALAQEQQDHEAATKLKDNLENALKLRPVELQQTRQLVRQAYQAIWKAKMDELAAQVRPYRDLIGACLAVGGQAGEGNNLGYTIQKMIGGEFERAEVQHFTDQLTQEMGLPASMTENLGDWV